MIVDGAARRAARLDMSAEGAEESQCWTYAEVASLPLSASAEEQMLLALRRLTATRDVEGVCEAVLQGVERVFGATSSWIMLYDRRARVLRTATFRGRGADVYGGLEIPADCGVAGLAFSRGEIHFVPDVLRENRWFNPERVRASGLRSVFVFPLVAGTRRMGVLGLDAPRFGPGQPPTLSDVKRLEVFAAQAAIGLLNAHLYQANRHERVRMRGLLRRQRALRQQVVDLSDELRKTYSVSMIVGESPGFRQALSELEQVAASDVTVLLLGETGTGKELLARAVHNGAAARRVRSLQSTALRSPSTSSRARCSGTSAAPSRAPRRGSRGDSSWRIVERCFSTKSGIFR